jgi:hypothetical protein
MIKEKRHVHITYKEHSPGERYEDKPLPLDVKAFVTEASDGIMKSEPLVLPKNGNNLHERTTLAFLKKEVLDTGRVLALGETFNTPKEREKYTALQAGSSEAYESASLEPTVDNIKDYYVKETAVEAYRHFLIRRTIKRLAKGGRVEGQYGTFHSLLHQELIDEGTEVSRDVKAQIFDWESIVMRKLLRGVKPDDIPGIEYKKAFATTLQPMHALMMGKSDWYDQVICGKPNEAHTDADKRFSRMVLNAMLDRLDEKRLESVLYELDCSLVFTANGLRDPESERPPTRGDYIDFLDRNMKDYPKSYAGFLWKRMRLSKAAEEFTAV